jgi:hypothetical protein
MRAFLTVAPMLLALTACLSDVVPPRDRIGLVQLRTFSNGGTPVLRAQAVFYNTAGLQILPLQPQECGLFAYTPPSSGAGAGPTINAGSAITFTVGGFSENAIPAINATYPVYNFPAGSYLDFTDGDSVTVSIPGALGGFEPMAIKMRLAESFTADTLPTYVENTAMALSWEPATTPGSIMIVALRYNSTPGSTEPDLEIGCAFPDNGSAEIPSTFANGYGGSVPETREYSFTRVRERIVEFDDRTRTRVRSIYEYPAIPLNDAP